MRTRRTKAAAQPHIWCLVPGGPGEDTAGFSLPVVLAEPLIDVEDDDAVVAIACRPVGLQDVDIQAPLGSIIDQDGDAYDIEAWLDAWMGEDEAEVVPIRAGRKRA